FKGIQDVAELTNKLSYSIEVQKDSYILSCTYDEKLEALKALQSFENIKDIEIKEVTLEDIYQEILTKRYAMNA
ncbi:ABC transporter ATP-binding protein, partial [Schinkia azotoformans]|nr:ABC transporter ATP-binding protein [Schinkia azotoformans]MEC1726306.1 ABC transporter ATP-binding protein [Schinkia azotoformans]